MTTLAVFFGVWFALAVVVAAFWAVTATVAKRRGTRQTPPRTEGTPPMTNPPDPPVLRGPALAPQTAATAPATTTAPPTLSKWAQIVHDVICGCPDGGDTIGHGGIDFETLAAELVTNITASLAPTIRYPIETKVWAGAAGALAASLGLAAVTLLLGRLDVIPSLLGDSPWAGALVLVLGIVLPPAASLLRGYLAAHTARPADALQGPR